MGLVGGDTLSSAAVLVRRDAQVHTDIDVTFSMSGETDTGLAFGASVDLDEDGTSVNPTTGHGETVFISGAWGRLSIGATDTAFDVGVDELALPGTIDEAHEGAGFAGNGGYIGATVQTNQDILYTYSIDGIGIALSATSNDDAGTGYNDGIDALIAVGLSYDAGPLALGFGYASGDVNATQDAVITGLSAQYTINGITISANGSTQDRDDWAADEETFGVGVRYTMDALSVGVHASNIDNVGGTSTSSAESMGLSANYALGGGATFQAGFSDSETTVAGTKTTADRWSMGLAMSF